MIWNVAESNSTLSQFLTLRAGDVIYAGKLEGLGPVVAGDARTAECRALRPLTADIAAKSSV